LNDHALSDIQRSKGVEYSPPVSDIFIFLLGGASLRQYPGFSQDPVQAERRLSNHNPFLFQLPGNGAQNGIILPMFQPPEYGNRPGIRTKGREHMGYFETTRHERLLDCSLLKGRQGLGKLSDLHPVDVIYVISQLRKCFSDMGDWRDPT